MVLALSPDDVALLAEALDIAESSQFFLTPPAPVIPWSALSGPQTMALESEADELYYGGGAGGGKSDLLLGYGLTRSRSGIVFRRQFKQLEGPEGLIERSKKIVGRSEHFNGSRMIWRLGAAMLEFGAVDHEDDKEKYQGRAHDFKGFDEITQFTETQYLYLTAWARTTLPGQRVRTICCGNPPQNAEGEWVVQRWAPWLDEQHPNPASPGELRWFARVDGKDTECAGPEAFEHNGETITPSSRTFIPARVTDNPYLLATDYVRRLQSMPEPLRSQLLYGDHAIGLQDDEWQVIPTTWVRAAQQRWKPERPKGTVLTQIGADVAQGGADNTLIARRYGNWFSEPEIHPGVTVPDAQHNADHIARALKEGGYAEIDSDGIGASTYHLLAVKLGRHRVRMYKGSAKTKMKDRARVLTFANVRSAAWWAFRDLLDPAHGSKVALPPSRELRAELCSARYETQTNGIKIEDKDDIKKRLGRSPDQGDAYVMAGWPGDKPLHGLIAAAMHQPEDATQAPDPMLGDAERDPSTLHAVEHWPKVRVDTPPVMVNGHSLGQIVG